MRVKSSGTRAFWDETMSQVIGIYRRLPVIRFRSYQLAYAYELQDLHQPITDNRIHACRIDYSGQNGFQFRPKSRKGV